MLIKSLNIEISKNEQKRHVLVWLMIASILTYIDAAKIGSKINFTATFLIIISYVISFYIIVFLLFMFWHRNRLISIGALFLVFLCYFGKDYLILVKIFPMLGLEKEMVVDSLKDISIEMNVSFITFSMILIQAFGYFHSKTGIMKLNEAKQRELTIMEKQLNFYKSQFSSHITLNFLNYIYYYFYDKSEKICNAIENFAEMLKYTLILKPDEKVKLQEEITYIQSFIELQKILSEEVYADLQVDLSSQDIEIHPYILVTFVENAFKHGKINDQDRPIIITLRNDANFLYFNVENMKENPNENSTGIGLTNAKNLLNLFYKRKYQLSITENLTTYSVNLKLSV